MQFQTYEDLLKHIFSLESMRDYSLEKVRKGAKLLGNPQDSYKVIHITGTNGKGSVANMCLSILKQANKKVGMFTSPHLIDIRERCKTQSGIISKDDFFRITNRILSLEINFSYFEICTLIAFIYFQEQQCEYAVIEVGFGGLLDSTNIVNPYITCITSIGYDHQSYLGWTLEEIATQKSGIIKPGIPVVINKHNPVIEENAAEKGSPVIFTNKEQSTNLLGDHQKKNASLAYEIASYLGIDEATIHQGLQQVQHKGRAEYITPNLLIDGAHNEDGLRTLKVFVDQESKKFHKVVYCFALKKEKKSDLVTYVMGENQEYIVVDCKKPILEDPQHLIDNMKGMSVSLASPQAIKTLAQQFPGILYVVFGSLYMIGEFYEE